jgi:hypothetical protein
LRLAGRDGGHDASDAALVRAERPGHASQPRLLDSGRESSEEVSLLKRKRTMVLPPSTYGFRAA